MTDTYIYDAFGLILEQTGTTENNYLYRGEQFDPELGFYYLRVRYMDPNVGRFVTMDSFSGLSRDPYSLHKYLYANANPINVTDPSGYSSLVEIQMATSIQSILAGIQTDIGFAIFDQIAEGGNAGLKSLAFGGLVTLYGPMVVHMFGNLLEMGGEVIGKILKSKSSAGDALANIFRKFSRKVRCWWNDHACFTGETLISTKNGSIPIKDIKVGDEVYSENVETGEKGFKRVKKVFVKETNVLIHLFLDDVEIKTTPEHPFWVTEKGWIPAGQLTLGDEVKFASDERAKVTSITQETLTQPITVYNVEVEGWHTYFVSQKGILVHNNCWRIGSRSARSVVGNADIVKDGKRWIVTPGRQPAVIKDKVERYARMMAEGKPKKFEWDKMSEPLLFYKFSDDEPLQLVNGRHRFMAARLTGTEIPEEAIKIVKGTELDKATRTWDNFGLW